MNATKLLLTLFGLSLVPASAFAKPVLWTLTNVQFDDGGTAAGSFIYDAEKSEDSDVNITTQGGSVRPGATYITVIGNKNLKSTGLFLTSWGDDQTGLPGLALFYTSALTDNGGTVLIRAPESLEVTCASPTCNGFTTPQRHVISGSLEGTSVLGCPSAPPGASEPTVSNDPCNPDYRNSYTSLVAAPNGGFWVQIDRSNGKDDLQNSSTITIAPAPQFENVADTGIIAGIPGQNGYFVVSPLGNIYSRGTAPVLCGGQLRNCTNFGSGGAIVWRGDQIFAAAATPDGQGLWAVDGLGNVFAAGTAKNYGQQIEPQGIDCSAIVPTTSGKGYWVLFEDGGVFSFGDAQFHGSTGGKRPGGSAATGLAPSMDLNGNITGYWMVASDGGVFSLNAPFLGSTGGKTNNPVSYIASLPNGHQYAWVDTLGNVTLSQGATFNKVIFTSALNGLVMAAAGSSAPGAPLSAEGPLGNAANYEWNLVPTPANGQLMRLMNVANGLCANVTEDSAGPYLIQYPCASVPQPNETFQLFASGGNVQFAPSSVPGQMVVMGSNNQLRLADLNQSPGLAPSATWTLSQGK